MLSFFTLMILTPLVLYLAHEMTSARERQLKQTLIRNGLHPLTYLTSWFLFYALVCFVLTLVYTIGLQSIVFFDSDFSLLFVMFFLGFLNLFGFINLV